MRYIHPFVRFDLCACSCLDLFDIVTIPLRGTNSHDFWNWIEDFDSWRSKYPLSYPGSEGCQIHSGFYKLWANSALKENTTAAMQRLVDKYGSNQTTYVVGHSMGGAMADLAALWLKFNLSLSDVRVTTFGQPRTGNKKFSDFFNMTVCSFLGCLLVGTLSGQYFGWTLPLLLSLLLASFSYV